MRWRLRSFVIIPLGAVLPLLPLLRMRRQSPSMLMATTNDNDGTLSFRACEAVPASYSWPSWSSSSSPWCCKLLPIFNTLSQFAAHPPRFAPTYFFAIFLMCSQFMIYHRCCCCCRSVFDFHFAPTCPRIASVELCGHGSVPNRVHLCGPWTHKKVKFMI